MEVPFFALKAFALQCGAATALISLMGMSALALFSVLRLGANSSTDLQKCAALSIGLGPIALSYLLSLALLIAPGYSPFTYWITASVFVSALALVRARGNLRVFLRVLRPLFKKLADSPVLIVPVLILIAATLYAIGTLVFLAFAVPLTGDDVQLYASAARIIAQTRSMAAYPFPGTGNGGFFGGWTHGAGYIILLVLADWIQQFVFQAGDMAALLPPAGIVKLVSVYFVCSTVVLLVLFGSREYPLAGWLASALLLATPLYFGSASVFHIDPIRIFGFTAGILALQMTAEKPDFLSAFIAGLAIGAAMFTHSIGFLIIPICIPLYLIVAKQLPGVRFITIGGIAAIGLILLAPTMATNYHKLGTILSGASTTGMLPNLFVDQDISLMRGIGTWSRKIVFGLFGSVTNFQNFGWVNLIFAACLFTSAFIHHRGLTAKDLVLNLKRLGGIPVGSGLSTVLFLTIIGFHGLLFLSILAGVDVLIKNSRYVMTIQPLMCLYSSLILAEVADLALGRSPHVGSL